VSARETAALLPTEQASGLFGQPLDYPYLVGAYLAVNAVSDLAILVDGPDCALGKAEHIHGKHDWRSTLLDCEGAHRVAFSGTDLARAVHARREPVVKSAAELAARSGVSAVLLTGLPLCLVAGGDYEALAREAAASSGKPVLALPARPLHADWLDGYADVLSVLARAVALQTGPRLADRVALVGSLMDRNEEDHRANLEELRRAFAALSLELVCVWPDGGVLEGLAAAGTAGAIVSLPNGRRAARILAERTGAKVVELDLPLGFEGSRRWMRALGEAFDRGRQAEEFCDRELGRVIPRLEWAVSHLFLNRRVMLAAEPSLLEALAGLCVELGATIAAAVSVGKFREEGQEERLRSLSPRVLARPTSGAFRAEWERARAEGLDLLVGPSDALREVGRKGRCMEFGFPSHFRHALAPQPFLLFEGALALVQRLSEGLLERP